jgi:hypothetical protein
MYANTKLRSPYTKQTHVALERDLGHGATLTASYLSSAGVKLWTVEDANLGATSSVVYSLADVNGNKIGSLTVPLWSTRNNSAYAHMYEVNNGGSAWYHAMVVQFRKSTAHGFTANASYTWSHAIDDVGGPLGSGGLPLSYSNEDHLLDKGSSATDQRHRAVIDWTWQPHLPQGVRLPVQRLFKGWELSAITTLASGQPETALVMVNGKQFSNLSIAFNSSLNGSGGWSRVPVLPVNNLYGELAYVVNLRLAQRMSFLMIEALNALNMQYDTKVQTIAYTATNGVLTPVSGFGSGVGGSGARTCRVGFRVDF